MAFGMSPFPLRFGSRQGGGGGDWLGEELVVDPPLDVPALWNDSTGGVVVSGGAATWTAAGSGARLARSSGSDHTFQDTDSYWVNVVISSITAGAIRLADSAATLYGENLTTAASHEFQIAGIVDRRFWLRSVGTTTASVSYFSIRRIIGTPP